MVLDPPPTPEQALIAKQELPWLESYIDRLKQPRAGMVIRLHYGIRCEPHTLAQTGLVMGISTERVRQIERKAFRALKRWMTPEVKPEVIAKARAETARSYHAQREAWAREEEERAEKHKRWLEKIGEEHNHRHRKDEPYIGGGFFGDRIHRQSEADKMWVAARNAWLYGEAE